MKNGKTRLIIRKLNINNHAHTKTTYQSILKPLQLTWWSIRANNNLLIILVLVLTLSVLAFWGYRLLKANKRIKQLAEYDDLTKIFNRRHFTHVANNAIRYCKSAEQELSVIMFDLDHFKKINDEHGHSCGDEALRHLSELLRTTLRETDIAGRYGGEEFGVVLLEADRTLGIQIADRIRRTVEASPIKAYDEEVGITVSVGGALFSGASLSAEELIEAADGALYQAKGMGRNQTVLAKGF